MTDSQTVGLTGSATTVFDLTDGEILTSDDAPHDLAASVRVVAIRSELG